MIEISPAFNLYFALSSHWFYSILPDSILIRLSFLFVTFLNFWLFILVVYFLFLYVNFIKPELEKTFFFFIILCDHQFESSNNLKACEINHNSRPYYLISKYIFTLFPWFWQFSNSSGKWPFSISFREKKINFSDDPFLFF